MRGPMLGQPVLDFLTITSAEFLHRSGNLFQQGQA